MRDDGMTGIMTLKRAGIKSIYNVSIIPRIVLSPAETKKLKPMAMLTEVLTIIAVLSILSTILSSVEPCVI